MLFLAVLVYRYSINGIRELTRIESLTKSPLLSFLSETYSGSSTIRAFKKQKDFVNQNNKLLNDNIVANRWQIGVNLWFALRLNFISVTIQGFATFFCILNKDSVDKIFLAMLLSNILSLQDLILSSTQLYS